MFGILDVTASFGVAKWDWQLDTEKVDERLYDAKQGGRNRISSV
jgi:PleD family two-component response regulator